MQLLEQEEADRLGDTGREYLGFAVDGGQRLQKLMDALLAYSRAGRSGRMVKEVDVELLMDELHRDLSVLIQETQGRIEWAQLPVVVCDPTDLRLILQNLLSNALKFRGDAPPEVRIEVEVTEDATVFSVRDNGWSGYGPRMRKGRDRT